MDICSLKFSSPTGVALPLAMDATAMKKYFYLGYGQGISFIQTVVAFGNFPSQKEVRISIGYNISTRMIKEEVEMALACSRSLQV